MEETEKQCRGKATFVGYKIHADKQNWKVVIAKKYSASSKSSGKEYYRTLFTSKNLEDATNWLFNYDCRNKFLDKQKLEDAIHSAKETVVFTLKQIKK